MDSESNHCIPWFGAPQRLTDTATPPPPYAPSSLTSTQTDQRRNYLIDSESNSDRVPSTRPQQVRRPSLYNYGATGYPVFNASSFPDIGGGTSTSRHRPPTQQDYHRFQTSVPSPLSALHYAPGPQTHQAPYQVPSMSRSPSSLFGVEYAYAPLPQVPSMHLAPTRSDPRMGSFVDPRYYRGPSTSNSEARTMDIHQQYMQRGVQMGPPRSASRGENRPLRDTTYHRRRAESTSQYGSSWSGSHAQFRPLASESSGSQMPILNRSTQSLEDTPSGQRPTQDLAIRLNHIIARYKRQPERPITVIEYLKDRDIGLFSETETLAQDWLPIVEEASDSEGKLELYIVNQNGHFVLALHTVVPRKRNKDGYVAQRAGETPRFISHTPLP